MHSACARRNQRFSMTRLYSSGCGARFLNSWSGTSVRASGKSGSVFSESLNPPGIAHAEVRNAKAASFKKFLCISCQPPDGTNIAVRRLSAAGFETPHPPDTTPPVPDRVSISSYPATDNHPMRPEDVKGMKFPIVPDFQKRNRPKMKSVPDQDRPMKRR